MRRREPEQEAESRNGEAEEMRNSKAVNPWLNCGESSNTGEIHTLARESVILHNLTP